MARRRGFRWTKAGEGVLPFAGDKIPKKAADDLENMQDSNVTVQTSLVEGSFDQPNDAAAPVKNSALETVQIKAVSAYPERLVILFSDGSTRVYVEEKL